MTFSEKLKSKIYSGTDITYDEAMTLYNEPLEELTCAADSIRKHYCEDKFDICTIINGKSGQCSENCKFCAQSSFYKTQAEQYSLLDDSELIDNARYNHERGVHRYSIVTSGRALSDAEVDKMCTAARKIVSQVGISVCISFGLLSEQQYARLKAAGVSRVHNNLETSRNFFRNVCTTHTYDDKISAIKAAQKAGLSVCSGGIMGLGETPSDKISMAFELKNLGIKSVPLNMLNPIKGTPFENNVPLTCNEMRRITAVYRFILPDAHIRLAGGRGIMDDKGRGCFESGANAVISGDMLTTSGVCIKDDMDMISELGYRTVLCDD